MMKYRYRLRMIFVKITAFLFFCSGVFAQVCTVQQNPVDSFDAKEVWSGFFDVDDDGVYTAGVDQLDNRIDARETTLVGDIDNDGIPEVVVDNYGNQTGSGSYNETTGAFNTTNSRLVVYDGVTGAVKYEGFPGVRLDQNNSSNAIADTDGDGFGEIYFVDNNLKGKNDPGGFNECDASFPCHLYRWDFDGTGLVQKWKGDMPFVEGYVPHIADLNEDGDVEVYMGSQVFRASDGVKILDAGYNPGDLGGSVAADVLDDSFCSDCEGLELIVGNRVYSLNDTLTAITLETSIVLPWENTGASRYATSVADMDNDGVLDIIYSSRETGTFGNDSRVVVRDGQSTTLMLDFEVNTGGAGIGRVNVADFDGDGCNEMGVVSYKRYTVIDDVFWDDKNPTSGYCDPTWTPIDNISAGGRALWSIDNSDRSSITGSSVFDFDKDGKAEVVYRDETDLFILDGEFGLGTTASSTSALTGSAVDTKFDVGCRSGTRWENPVIADVNADGLTEIAVVCGSGTRGGTVKLFTTFDSINQQRAPSRSVWNQHGYNVTNVYDNLQIPQEINYNPTRDNGIHDNFLTQSIPVNGDFLTPDLPPGENYAPDGTIAIDAIDTTQCASGMNVQVTIGNEGNAIFPGSSILSVYNDDPTAGNPSVLYTGTIGTSVATGSTLPLDILLSTCDSPLYVTVNDGSDTRPYSLVGTGFVGSGTSTQECDYTNNMDTISFSYCGDGIEDTGEECDDGNDQPGDGCSIYCEIEYCWDDAPLNDTTKNFAVTTVSPLAIGGSSSQPNSKVAICFEDTTGTRDIYYTTTDLSGSFIFLPSTTIGRGPYIAPWVNVGVMLHDENGLDIDHHAVMILE